MPVLHNIVRDKLGKDAAAGNLLSTTKVVSGTQKSTTDKVIKPTGANVEQNENSTINITDSNALPRTVNKDRSESLNEAKIAKLTKEMMAAKPLSKESANFQALNRKEAQYVHRTLKLHLEMCTHLLYDFNDELAHSTQKCKKRMILIGLVEYISCQNVAENLPEKFFPDIVQMIEANLFRTLPPKSYDYSFDGFDDEEQRAEKAWPHIQVVYEFFTRFILCPKVDARAARKYITQTFISNLMSLFESEDMREREYLKNILHRIYAKFMVHRAFIRKCIKNKFLTIILDEVHADSICTYNGVAEILEILASIINGFALPLKQEHLESLIMVLIPLHKVKGLDRFQRQLSYCICQYVGKDKNTADVIVRGLIRIWPATNSPKQVLFLLELEEILELTLHHPVFLRYMVPFVNQLTRCLESPHFQVVEKILFIFQNEMMVKLIAQKHSNAIPAIMHRLQILMDEHWNPLVVSLAYDSLRLMKDIDRKNAKRESRKLKTEKAKIEDRIKRWDALSGILEQENYEDID